MPEFLGAPPVEPLMTEMEKSIAWELYMEREIGRICAEAKEHNDPPKHTLLRLAEEGARLFLADGVRISIFEYLVEGSSTDPQEAWHTYAGKHSKAVGFEKEVQSGETVRGGTVGLPVNILGKHAAFISFERTQAEFSNNEARYIQKYVQRVEELMHDLLYKNASESIIGQFLPLLSLQGEMRPRLGSPAILLLDMKGYSALSELFANDPDALAKKIEAYQAATILPIVNRGGIVNNTVGDATMALYLEQRNEHPTLTAVKDGLEILELLKQTQDVLGIKFDARIGVAKAAPDTQVALGLFGLAPYKQLTGIGRRANLAARLETASPLGGVYMDAVSFNTLVLEAAEEGLEVVADHTGEVELKGVGKHDTYLVTALNKKDAPITSLTA